MGAGKCLFFVGGGDRIATGVHWPKNPNRK